MNSFLTGFGYPWRGLGFLFQPRLRRLALLPIVVNVVLFTIAFYFLAVYLDNWIDTLLPWWLKWLEWLLWPLFALLALLATLFSFTRLANLIGMPFNTRLCHVLVRMQPDGALMQAVERRRQRNSLLLFSREILKLIVYLAWFLPLLTLSFIPVLGQVAQVVMLFFLAYWSAIEYLDYPLGEVGFSLKKLRACIREQGLLTLGFGAGQMILTLTPVLNLMAVPAGVVGATRLCQDHPPRTLVETPESDPA